MRGKTADIGKGRPLCNISSSPGKNRGSIHIQKLEIESIVSKDEIRLNSGESNFRHRANREIVLSHRHEMACQADSNEYESNRDIATAINVTDYIGKIPLFKKLKSPSPIRRVSKGVRNSEKSYLK